MMASIFNRDFWDFSQAITEENFLHHEIWDVFTFGIPPVAIDIMVSVKGLDFDQAFRHAVEFYDEGLRIRVIQMTDLVLSKKASNRPKDQDDLQNLQ
jgi:hypothetical protein